LIGAGLLVRSFVALTNVDPGFSRDRVASLQIFIWGRYRTPETRAAYVNETLARIEALPDVAAAGVTTALPLLESSATTSVSLQIEGQPPVLAGQEPVAQISVATGGYFRAIGAQLLRGRVFNADWRCRRLCFNSLNVVVVVRCCCERPGNICRGYLVTAGGSTACVLLAGPASDAHRAVGRAAIRVS
jgi:hypothetical protein